MRKWMQDRLRRKKKAKDKASAGPAPAPLQPAYFDAHPLPAAEEPQAYEAEPVSEPAEAEPAEASSPASADAAEEKGGPRRRRRRGRGGRGRRKPATAAAEAPAAEPSPEQAEEPVSPAPAAAARASKGVVVLAIGLPGSGKSSWFKRHNLTPLSSDLLRALLFDDAQEQRFQDLVFSNLRSLLRARLIARRPANYVDATNLTPHERHGWIKLARDFGYEPQAVYFDVPVEVCLERNRRRDRAVDEAVMQRMAAKMKAPTFEEGFTKITVVRVKKKDDASS